MSEVTNEIIYEVLKSIQSTLSNHGHQLKELKDSGIAIREDILGVRNDLLRHEKALATLEAEVDHIKNRLDLSN